MSRSCLHVDVIFYGTYLQCGILTSVFQSVTESFALLMEFLKRILHCCFVWIIIFSIELLFAFTLSLCFVLIWVQLLWVTFNYWPGMLQVISPVNWLFPYVEHILPKYAHIPSIICTTILHVTFSMFYAEFIPNKL